MNLIDQYPLGARIFASKASGVCKAGEAGLVVEEYELDGRSGRTIIFEQGNYDGFSPEELAIFTLPEGSVDSKVAHYTFSNVGRLAEDLHKGIFDFSVFPNYPEWLAAKEKKQGSPKPFA